MNFIVFNFICIYYEIMSSKPFKRMRAKFDTDQISSKYLLEIVTLVACYTFCTLLNYVSVPNTLSSV
jgi:hypothetical protein